MSGRRGRLRVGLRSRRDCFYFVKTRNDVSVSMPVDFDFFLEDVCVTCNISTIVSGY
jgi:hypothetical protein